MKKTAIRSVWFFALVIFLSSACSHAVVVKGNSSKPLPPGQAKKVAGSQSAKPFAPGQQKKKN